MASMHPCRDLSFVICCHSKLLENLQKCIRIIISWMPILADTLCCNAPCLLRDLRTTLCVIFSICLSFFFPGKNVYYNPQIWWRWYVWKLFRIFFPELIRIYIGECSMFSANKWDILIDFTCGGSEMANNFCQWSSAKDGFTDFIFHLLLFS